MQIKQTTIKDIQYLRDVIYSTVQQKVDIAYGSEYVQLKDFKSNDAAEKLYDMFDIKRVKHVIDGETQILLYITSSDRFVRYDELKKLVDDKIKYYLFDVIAK